MFHWQDVRYALRLLARAPGFTLLTVLVLAGGLGLSIFTFSFLYTAMLKPLPLAEGDRVVRVLATVQGLTAGAIDAADLAAMRGRITTLTDLGGYDTQELVLGTGEGTRTIDATATEWNIFQATRTPAALGRGFTAEDGLPGAEPVIVLTHATWISVFGGDAGVINSIIRLNGKATRVIGVMPAGYGFPVASGSWIPIRPELRTQVVADQERLMAYARLAPGRSASEAGAELTALLRAVQSGRPAKVEPLRSTPADGMKVQSYPIAQIGDEAPLVLAVLNLVATLILLLACINVTNLLLARANERVRETAVRLALGAPRSRLVMQSLWEILILCGLGGALATGFAVWLLTGVNSWARTQLEGNLAFWWVWGFDRSVLLGAGAFVTLAVIVLGVIASRRAVSTEITAVLKEGAAGAGGSSQGRMARLLVIVQVTTVSLLLFFGAMSAIVAWRVVHVDLGYKTENLLSTGIEPSAERYPDAEARGRFYQALFDGLSARPELDGVVLRRRVGDINDEDGAFEQGGALPDAPASRAHVQALLGPLTPLGVGLLEGRFFDSRDVPGGEPVVLVSRAMAAMYWPGRSPVGAQIRLTGQGKDQPFRTVVGVVGDVLLGNPLGRDRSPVAVYVPIRQVDVTSVAVAFRHRGSEPAARSAFHEALGAIDPLVAPSNIQSFKEILAKMTEIARMVTSLFGGAFGFALLLAVSGTYGLMAWSIGRRTREIGIRRALGATDRTIYQLLLSHGVRQLGIGALIALPLALLVGWAFSLFFPISAGISALVAVLVSAAVLGVVLLATWVPTRRAVHIEVRDALWRE